MILPIKHRVNRELEIHQKQTQINIDNIRENQNIVDYDYKVRDDVMLSKHAAYKYEMPYMGPFVITRCWTNGTVSLQIGATEIRYNTRHINPYKLDTTEGGISWLSMNIFSYQGMRVQVVKSAFFRIGDTLGKGS